MADVIIHMATVCLGRGVDKECGCNISGTWLAGVVLVIAGNLEYVIVIYWSLSYGLLTTNPGISVRICTDLYRFAQKLFSKLQL